MILIGSRRKFEFRKSSPSLRSAAIELSRFVGRERLSRALIFLGRSLVSRWPAMEKPSVLMSRSLPRNAALGLSGITRFDQGSTEFLPTRRGNQPITCVDSGLSARRAVRSSRNGNLIQCLLHPGPCKTQKSQSLLTWAPTFFNGCQARIPLTTSPCTSVSRKSRPL